MLRKHLPDVLIVAGLLLLPLLFFAPVTIGGRTLLPADNLYQFEPWRSARDALGVPEVPHNALLSDLVLQNYQWKAFIRRSLDAGVIPLWQPNQFAGTPFLAAGQHGALYPFSLLYYVLPLPRAYGWFTVSQLWLAGALMYLFARGLRLSRAAGAVAGVAYQFSAFFIVSAVFPMMIAGAAWLPLLLLMIECVIERRPLRGDRPATVPWIAVGALALMMNIFAGHVEITYYTLIVMAYWAAARLLWAWWRDRAAWRRLLRPAGSLLLMVALGVGLGAAQFLPLYELGTRNFREAAASFDEVRSYAFPARHLAKFVLPDAFGNPAQHSYRDVFSGDVIAQDWQRPCAGCPGGFARVTDTDFGIKNYVEGGAYVGILTLVLAGIGLLARRPTDTVDDRRGGFGNPPLQGASSLSAQTSPPQSPSPAELERGTSPLAVGDSPSLAVPGRGAYGTTPLQGASSLSAQASPPQSPSPAELERGTSPPAVGDSPSLAVPGRESGGGAYGTTPLQGAASLSAQASPPQSPSPAELERGTSPPAVGDSPSLAVPGRGSGGGAYGTTPLQGAASLSAQASPPQSPSPAELERGTSPLAVGDSPSLAVPGRGSGGGAYGTTPQLRTAAPHRAILGVLALVSLTFAFGLPTYAVLYYAFPNLNQLHTPFRWVWPFTFCAAALAGFGVDALRRAAAQRARWVTWLGGGLIALGAAILGGLLLSRAAYDTFAPLVERVYSGLAKADQAFPDARAFYSYEFWNVLALGLFVLAAGIVVALSRSGARLPRRLGSVPLWEALAVGVVALDLVIAGWGFNPSADPAWLDYTPDAVRWLQDRQAEGVPFRYTTVNFGANPLHANSTWRYDLHDARGYDSMIPRQYAEYMGLIAAQGGLLHNRIDPIAGDNTGALASPLLDLLNVRYIVADQIVADAEALGLREAYADEALRIYENLDALPRAYTLPYYDLTEPLCGAVPDDFATIVSSPDFAADPRRVVIEGFSDAASCERVYEWPRPEHEADPVYAQITHYGAIEVIVTPEVSEESWLVLADSYYPGWKAFVRPAGSDEDQEQETPIYRVNGNFRGVRLEAGAWTVRFRYSPPTFQVGAFLSFLSGMLIIFMLMLWLWQRLYRPDAEADSARRIAKNSLAPIVLNLFNRGIDFAFAFIMLRILGPADAGVYYYAIVIFGWFDILANFGLNTLLTREVARDRSAAGRYLLNSTALRLALSALGIPLMLGFLAARQAAVSPALDGQAIAAILLLYVGLLPGSLSTGLTALFYAFEKAEHPAAITTVSTLVKVTLGLGTLLLGWGVVGLAGGAVLTNFVTLAALGWLARPLAHGVFAERLDGALMRSMIGASWPLMINHLLATVFFKIDIVLMEAISGHTIVGQYSTAYKWLDALNIIPAFLTMALLPVMARQAHEDRAALRRNYTLAVKLLVIVALPVAVMTTFIAAPLIRILGGAEYLPAGGIALQIMIWSIPIGWINSVTNYVIVALDRQRTLTLAFAVGVIFNVAANLIFLPAYSYRAAAVIHILSEATLFVAFYWIIRQEMGGMGWRRALWRPALAALVLLGVTLALWQVAPLAGLLLSPLVYGAGLLALRPFAPEELARVAPLLPGRLRRWALRGEAAHSVP